MLVAVSYTHLDVYKRQFGYTSHLFADCETKAGCPILWPLYKKNISILPVTTGTAAETLVMLLDLGGLACLAYFV